MAISSPSLLVSSHPSSLPLFSRFEPKLIEMPSFPFPSPPPLRHLPIRSSTSQAGPLFQDRNNRTLFPFGDEKHSMPTPSHRWQRVLLKVSGEALAGDHKENIDPKVVFFAFAITLSLICHFFSSFWFFCFLT